MKNIVIFLLLMGLTISVQAGVVGQPLEYRDGETVMQGYLAYDDAIEGNRPGILVVHEWWGHNDYARRRAEQLAGMGYTALAVDMYGEGKQATHPKDAGKFAGEVKKNMAVATARFEAARDLLAAHPTVKGDAISAIGYCFGGGIVLEMARRGVDLDLVASFHGSLPTEHPAQTGKVKAEVLIFNGAADPFVKPEQIEAFVAEMEAAGVKYSFTNYDGAKHSFTNKDADTYGEKFSLPLAYDEAADNQSWETLSQALRKAYGK
ncbi:MAG: dienelactone hydrolase family protein [Candidatus Thiodiazotropha sp. (ex Myrtea spinifera)]|nr:dienelactone hydrolase family protein [Candidatus Thiodiazotropha sp. (ex Myrtea spinifera)]MCU7828526.1 dienelactone hydrolase family protein [Candidatus Thiodiazotropha sp. (ex Myrtea sp. 'scaly one' KF741663)]